MENNSYTSFDLMKIFNIKRGSWTSIKNKFDLDNYGQKVIIGKKEKFLYSQDAYNILAENFDNNFRQNIQEEMKDNPKMLLLVQQNNILSKTIEEYKDLNKTFQNLYFQEKQKNEENIAKNIEMQCENENLRKEIDKLKNRNFIQRLLNL